jgi:tRNA (cytidine/uridine-2'-O-)-methyltransferase
MRIALYQPEIAGNVGAVMRLGACLGVAVDLIEPMGFDWEDKRVRRTAMDYIDHVEVVRHADFRAFRQARAGRLCLFTTKADTSAHDFRFEAGDVLLFGQESAGVPAAIADAADARLRLPIRAEVRSYNLATAAAIAVAEALRQTGELPR